MNEIIPGILEKEWSEIERKIEIARPFAKTLHIDIIDGKFADNTTFLDPEPFQRYSQDFFLELHMMVEEPIQYIQPFADGGFKRFIGHIETMSDQERFVGEAQLVGEAVLALDGKTPVDALTAEKFDLDGILVMMINAGFSGQQFQPELLRKVELLRMNFDGPIEVDGGINLDTLRMSKQAGATRFVSTSCLFGSDHPDEMFQTLSQL